MMVSELDVDEIEALGRTLDAGSNRCTIEQNAPTVALVISVAVSVGASGTALPGGANSDPLSTFINARSSAATTLGLDGLLFRSQSPSHARAVMGSEEGFSRARTVSPLHNVASRVDGILTFPPGAEGARAAVLWGKKNLISL